MTTMSVQMSLAQGRVHKRARDNDGSPIGIANENPILDSREYVVEFKDDTRAELSANAIAHSMYAQCDPDGNTYVLFYYITDFRRNKTDLRYIDQRLRKSDGYKFLRQSTAGCQLCVIWKYRSTSWGKLSDIKELHPLEMAEYDVSQSLEREPAFNWWVPFVLKKRDRIISLVKQRSARYLKRNEKYRIILNKTVKEAKMLDKANGNTLWSNAIAKKMKSFKVAFKILDNDKSVPRNHQFVKYDMIFNVKMENFRRKARLVSGGHTEKAPAVVINASVVSC